MATRRRTTYDAYGDQVTSTNPVGDITTTCYNADGWKVASYTPKAGSITCSSSPPASAYETTYSYVQANGQVDGFGDVQKVTAPLSRDDHYTYDADRNLISTTDADGNTDHYVYDLANEQTDVKQANGTDQHTDYTLDGQVRTRRTATATRPHLRVQRPRPGDQRDRRSGQRDHLHLRRGRQPAHRAGAGWQLRRPPAAPQ